MVKKVDPRTQPAYLISEVAQYLSVAPSTLRYWVNGRDNYSGLIVPASNEKPVLLSFINLVELHVIRSITREHHFPFVKLRSALEYINTRFKKDHPLVSHKFETDGVGLFIRHLGSLIDISQSGQLAIKDVVSAALKRIERDAQGVPIKLYPFTRSSIENAPSSIVIDPAISGGRPVIVGTGIATEIIAERYKAGESIAELAKDYGRKKEEIEEAVRSELYQAA